MHTSVRGKAGYLPTLDLNAGVTHQELSGNSQFGSIFDGNITQYELTGNMAWEADVWGKIRSNKRASEAGYLQSVAAHQAVKTELVAQIATVYYQLLTLDAQLEIVEKTLANRSSSLETTEALKEAGIVTEVAVKQTEAQLYNAEVLRIDLKRDIALTENTFSILLGSSPADIERSRLEEQEVVADLNTGYPVQLLRNRPDVIAAEYQLVEAFEMSNVARSNFLSFFEDKQLPPDFKVWKLDRLLSANSIFATFVGSLAQPLLNRRQIKTQFEVAQSQQEIAYLRFKQALLTAEREVSDALYSYAAAEEKIGFSTKEFEAYDTATRYSEELLDNGLANYLEVLTARENALNAEVRITTTRFEQMQAVVELYRALGGGKE
jgi:outer membrane protein, multidrug efflux system